MVLCPECEADLDIDVDEVDEGDVVSCAECGSDFEVVGADPLELARMSDEDEDEDEAEFGEDEEE
jgi:alpha-aminoadipate carrier protein LysW